MSLLTPKDVAESNPVESDAAFQGFLNATPKGIALVPEPYGETKTPVLRSDAGDFRKWLSASRPDVIVAPVPQADRLVLRSSEYWLPLAFLASDITLPIYLNLVSNYLYDRMKGSLAGEKPRINFSATYADKKSGITKRFNFSGDADSLKTVIKKFDLNEFMDDDRSAK
jgi:hypothetical protein